MPRRAATAAVQQQAQLDVSEDDFRKPNFILSPPDSTRENIPTLTQRGATRARDAKSTTTLKQVTTCSSATLGMPSRTTRSRVNQTTTARTRRRVMAERTNLPNTHESVILPTCENIDDHQTLHTSHHHRPLSLKSSRQNPAKRSTTRSKRKQSPALPLPHDYDPLDQQSNCVLNLDNSPADNSPDRDILPSREPTYDYDVDDVDQPFNPLTNYSTRCIPPLVPRTGSAVARPASQLSSSVCYRSADPSYYAAEAELRNSNTESSLRRHLAELQHDYDKLEAKYLSLQKVALHDAESNFQKLRKACEYKAQAQDKVICSLKHELSLSSRQSDEITRLEARINELECENTRLVADKASLSKALHESKCETKSLTAKLAATRSSSVPNDMSLRGVTNATTTTAAASGIVTQSNTKNNTANRIANAAAVAAAANEATEAIRLLKLKEELYSDLTGLMIYNIKRLDNENVFDCLQTGHNGTLRFNLAYPNHDSANGAGGSGANGGGSMSYEDMEISYTPILHEQNDHALIEILPDYLTEDICFPQSSVAKFYQRVVDSLNRPVDTMDTGS